MRNVIGSIAVGALALALAAPVLGGDHEKTSAAGKSVFSSENPFAKAIKYVKNNKTQFKRCPDGTTESWEGENGLVCRGKGYTVTCTHDCDWIQGEEGAYCVAKNIKCDPPQGFGGGSSDHGHQAP